MSDGGTDHPFARVIQCSHPDHVHRVFDFTEMWKGAREESVYHMWSGGFSGRPTLADALWAGVKHSAEGKNPAYLTRMLGALRTFWRFLDSYEKRGWTPIAALEDLPLALPTLWLTPADGTWDPPPHWAYSVTRALVLKAWQDRFGGTRPWTWQPYPSKGSISEKDLPSESEIKAAMSSLKERARSIIERWKQADAQAAEGRNLLAVTRNGSGKMPPNFRPVERDAHTTYRALIAHCGKPLPTLNDLKGALGLSDRSGGYPRWWPRYSEGHSKSGSFVILDEIQEGLYPTIDDACCFVTLLMARTGWNESTAEALDVSDSNWARPHGETASSKLWMLTSWKERAKAWQWTLSMEKTTTGAYNLVTVMRDRTAALREWVDSNPTASLQPTIAKRSPWIAAGGATSVGRVVTLGSTSIAVWWKRHIAQHNEDAPAHRQIPLSMSPSDWRDVFASHVFSDSRYSWVLVQWALGHKHVAATRHYLRSRIWRRASEKKLTHLVTVLIDGIEVSARVDAVILRARVEFGFSPTASDVGRLDAHREAIHERDLTYSGYQCTDSTHPPTGIDPGNPSDGTMPCRRGDRCGGCPIGKAIDGRSLAKRTAELTWLRRRVSAVIWAEAQYGSDLEALQASLKQWPESEVTGWLSYWTTEIESGRHKVIRFGARQ